MAREKKTPQLGGSNPKNIDVLVAAGILTKAEGAKARARFSKAKATTTKKKK